MSAPARRVLSLLAAYPPTHNGGAEWAAHELHRYLHHERGFRVIVASTALGVSSFEGIETRPLFGAEPLNDLVAACDLILSQQFYSPLAIHLGRRLGKPVLHLVHSTTPRDYLRTAERQYIVYNSEWVAQAMAFPQPSIVVPPPVDWRRYEVATTRRCITLMNVAEAKGGAVLVEIARRMPERDFLGVLSFHGEMIVESSLANVRYLDMVPDARVVYAQTGILLMPSSYESWGRAGVEAMASGIPVIAHPTPGLRESLGEAALFCDRDRIDDWIETIRALDDPQRYAEISERCRARARALDPAADLRRFGDFVEAILAARSSPAGDC